MIMLGRMYALLQNHKRFATGHSWIWRLKTNIARHPSLYLMMIPVAAFYLIFCYWPMYGVLISFQDFKPAKGIWGSAWVGLSHFSSFVNGMYFERLVRNTLSINIGQLLFGFPLPIIFAILLNELRSVWFRRTVQTVTYMPYFISATVVCGLVVQFTRVDGILTYFLSFFGVQQTNLLTVSRYFQPIYIGMTIWQELGWSSIIYFAALSGIDQELYEAAVIDGAGRFRKMLSVTLPGIAPTIVILLILRIGNLMNLGWDRIILLYNERVYETADVISTYVYRRGLLKFEYSYGAAVGLMNSVINIFLLLGANWVSRKLSENSLW